jgi:malto-oligosyltrehalose trehalohydrolase
MSMSTEIHIPPHSQVATTHGPQVRPDGTVQFRLWAPACERVELEILGHPGPRAMIAAGEGWHDLSTEAGPGTRYRFVLPDGLRIPDPASRFQPEDVHGPSEVIDLASWAWSDTGWNGRPWHEAVLYELHLGTFTPEGTFRAAIEKLDHLVDLGVTALDVMPIADFRGRRNWGYDGVLLYAPDSSYGRPEELKLLVEAAHARGVMVILDVVYNHFGADGNYLPLYAPQFFTNRHRTPWGAAVNFDDPGSQVVREFVIQNALYWVQQFHMDGLRLDAVHAIHDESPKHVLEELAERLRAAVPRRQVHVILENEENRARWLERDGAMRPRFYTAQWNDDVHHVLHTAVTGEDNGYYVEYRGDTVKLGRALAEGFAFQGEMMAYRGAPRGEPCGHLPPAAFVAFLQNHDQVGNRAFGDRIGATVPQDALRAAAAVYLLLPQVPMLFMGEEWNASSPFPFFCDFEPELAEAVRKGRREEFSKFPEFRDPQQRDRIPDPQAEETFSSASLRWREVADPSHRESLEWYRRILARRRESIWPLLARIRRAGNFEVLARGAVVVRWQAGESEELVLAANLSDVPVAGFPLATALPIWKEGATDGRTFQPWTVLWWLDGQTAGQTGEK